MTDSGPVTFAELVEKRGTDPDCAQRPLARIGDASVTYGEYRQACRRWAAALTDRGPGDRPLRVGVLMNNSLDFLTACGATAYAGATLFLLNTGIGGEVLRRVIERAAPDVLLVDPANHATLEAADTGHTCVGVRGAEWGSRLESADAESVDGSRVRPETPWMVIYTSGTTGTPKGVISSHAKVHRITSAITSMLRLTSADVGYISMPLFHSNALWLNFIPAVRAGARVVLRERFSASKFLDDVLNHGVTYWNYVGQPMHYVLDAIARRYDGDAERMTAEVENHPKNRLRLAIGNGASGSERARFAQTLGVEHVYEAYGSTEGEVITWCLPGHPQDSVGEITSADITVLNRDGEECETLEVDAQGRWRNRAAAVGEIVRRGRRTNFEGYWQMPEASQQRVRGGVYHSGDLGAIRVVRNKRFLYFVGRTEDWIRKDGENFSAEAVVGLVEAAPGIDRAVAFGVPHPASDEWVMVAFTLRDGSRFDAEAFFDHCEQRIAEGADRKWMPDFVRVVDDFEWTETHKIKVRNLRRDGFDPTRASGLYFRPRSEGRFRPFSMEDYESIREAFERTGRADRLNQG